MGINPNTAIDVDPPAAPAFEVQPPSTEIYLQSATSVAPQAAPANSLDPLAGAGVSLTKIVLGMLTGVLLLLLGSLIYQETRFHDLTTDAYRSAVGSIVSVPMVSTRRAAFETVLNALHNVEKNPTRSAVLSAAAASLTSLRGGGADEFALETLASDIRALVPTKAGQPVDPGKLRDILVRADALSKSTLASSETLEQLKARQELLKAYMEATNATRDFWTRTAQMILLNLLLPVLTALLGYVFASKPFGK